MQLRWVLGASEQDTGARVIGGLADRNLERIRRLFGDLLRYETGPLAL